MNKKMNRRSFLGGTAALASAGSLGLSSADTMSKVIIPSYGPSPDIAKLNANENPYGPSPAALRAIADASRRGAYYVNDSINVLTAMIAERNNLKPENIMLSSGSSGVLTYAVNAASTRGKILGPDLFWDTTARAPERQGGPEIKRIAKTADLSIDLDALYNAIDDDVALVQVTNPNNPTGLKVDSDKLREFCKRASKKTIVLVDEAYNELTDNPEKDTMVSLINEGHNVLVARTFSKIYGMAGLRVGYMMGSEELLEFIKPFGLAHYAMNQAGVAAAVACYNDEAFLKYSLSKVKEGREMVLDALKTNELTALPSSTSFMFVDLGKLNAETFREKMAEQNVLIRGIYRDYTHWSRVSMGYIEDVYKYTLALPRALEATAKA